MLRPITPTILLVGLMTALTACEGILPRDEPAPPASLPPAPPPADRDDSSEANASRFSRAIRLLQKGDMISARRELNALLAVRPNYRLARDLLEQMDADPQEVLGADFAYYEVQSGDSLSRIAERFLGDPLKFVILARYNNMTDPSVLKRGQIIRVPKTDADASDLAGSATRAEQPPRVAPLPPDVSPQVPGEAGELQLSDAYIDAKLAYHAGEYSKAISILEDDVDRSSPTRTIQLLVQSYLAESVRQAAEGRLAASRALLEKAADLDPDDDTVAARLAAMSDRMESKRLYDKGVEQVDAGQYAEAYETFSRALEVQPDNAPAQQQRERIKSNVVDLYHRRATSLYRQQKLDEAIALWDRVLAIDPTFESARLNRTRARELKQMLIELEDDK